MKLGHPIVSTVAVAMGLLAGAGMVLHAQESVRGTEWRLDDVNVVDVERGRILPRHSIQMRGVRIQAVAPQAAVARESADRVVAGRGAFVIPGLYDMHLHLSQAGVTAQASGALDKATAGGVLGVRDLGFPLHSVATLADLHSQRLRPGAGPRNWYAGPILNAPPVPADQPQLLDGTDATHVRDVLRQLRLAGASAVKVHDRLTLENYQMVVREARAQGLPVVGHMPALVPLEVIGSAGQRSVEHLGGLTHGLLMASSRDENARARAGAALVPDNFRRLYTVVMSAEHLNPLLDGFDPQRCAKVAERLRQADVWQVPNLILWKGWAYRWFQRAPEADRAARKRLLTVINEITRILHRAGVPIMVGTDSVGTVQDEMEALIEAGLTPLAALQAATLAPARFLGLADTVGAIKAGFDADFVLLDGDPLADLAATRRVLAVVFQGQLRPVSPQWRE